MYINAPRFRPPRGRLILTSTTLEEFRAEAAAEAAALAAAGGSSAGAAAPDPAASASPIVGAIGPRRPVTRWVAVTPESQAYYFWQHEQLGWWAWSTAFAVPGQAPRWRPIVAPLMLVARLEGLVLTFTDWPTTGLEQHDWRHEVGTVARLGTNPRSGWPGEPPVAVLLAEAA